MFLSRFWGDFVSMEGRRKGEFRSLEVRRKYIALNKNWNCWVFYKHQTILAKLFKKKAKITISFWSKNLKNNIILSVISIYHFPFCILLIFVVLFMIWITDKLKIFRLYEKDEFMKIHSCIIFPIVSVFFIPLDFPMLRYSFMFWIF